MVISSSGNLEFLILTPCVTFNKRRIRGRRARIIKNSKGNVSTQSKVHFKQLQDKTSEYARKTRRSVDLDKIRSKRDKFKSKFKNIVDIEEDDIPKWMRPPKWIKPAYVEIFCGFILFLFTFIEFNNRNALFVSGEWELSQTQYVIEWITLLILLFIIIIYIATTFTHF